MQSLLSNNMQSLWVQLKAPRSAPWNTVIICILFSRVLGRWLVPRFSNYGWKFQSPIEYLTLGYIRSFAGYDHYNLKSPNGTLELFWRKTWCTIKILLGQQGRFPWDKALCEHQHSRNKTNGTTSLGRGSEHQHSGTGETKLPGRCPWDEAV